MPEIELSSSQREVLKTLVDIFGREEKAVKGREIAERTGRSPGTVRNQMQSLKALGLVEGIPGPKGGYKPTTEAYESLDIEEMNESASVPLLRNGKKIDANVVEVDLTSVHHPSLCRAEIRGEGEIRSFREGDEIEIGPTPISRLVIRGTVDGKDQTEGVLICKIDEMKAPAENSN